MLIDVRSGMTFDEILAHGEDDSLYSALKSTVLDDVAFATNTNAHSDIQQLIEQLNVAPNADTQARVSDAIASYFIDRGADITAVVQSDLVAQQAVRQKLANLNIAAELLPPEQTLVPDLVDLIATNDFKAIFTING